MKLSELLDEDVILTTLESEDKEEAFAEMIEQLVRAGRITDREQALDAILTRERVATTGIGNGVAVPHGKNASVPQLSAALGLSADGIDYDAADEAPVHVVFLILAEANNPGPHVQCLGEIARLLQAPGFCDRLRQATSATDALAIIRAEE
ncbi:PTS sugar transporter subunit IIA [bacterium]|nr:PTS sugar transporter subunit IIA [bacterium]